MIFIQVKFYVWRIVIQILLVSIISEVFYESIFMVGRYENLMVTLLSNPSMPWKKLTTREVDESQTEVIIIMIKVTSIWKAFLKGNFGYLAADEIDTDKGASVPGMNV
ncbi:MAG: DUF1385 domain-containing protein [Lachnospiraceae bacterium]|nr:DUF1385 domain-containing protein [Lachnospiraceae bacterium]